MSIEIRNVSKNFGDFKALRDVSLNIESGELVALLGPSGCGKTTLLRIIAGLETADAGSILFAGADTTAVHVRERQVGFVFQHYALFRHMTVFENVAFGLRVKPRGQRPGDGRVRRGVGGVRPYPRPDQHHAAARGDPLQRIPVGGGICRRLPAGAAGPGHAGDQVGGRMAART